MAKITGKYSALPDLESKHITGALGVVNPQGDVIINFYNESVSLPDAYEVILDTDGKAKEEVQKFNEKKADLSRTIVASVVMNMNTLRSIQTWLGQFVDSIPEEHANNGKENSRDKH